MAWTRGETADAGAGSSDDVCGMVEVPAGTFTMGCEGTEPECGPDQSPSHSVSLPAFLIDRTEVTLSAYRACVAAGRCTAATDPVCCWAPGARPLRPVECVSWNDAKGFCEWAGKRLRPRPHSPRASRQDPARCSVARAGAPERVTARRRRRSVGSVASPLPHAEDRVGSYWRPPLRASDSETLPADLRGPSWQLGRAFPHGYARPSVPRAARSHSASVGGGSRLGR